MKKLLIPLIAAFAANTVSAAAPQQVIDISTDKVSMVLTAAPGGEVYFRHFGGRIDDPAPLADYKSNRRSDHGTEDLAYPATGGRNFREPALRVTHADGDMNTELRYVSHASKQLSDKNVTETVVKMTDCCQALDVELVFTAYARENVITTHAVIRNREKGPVTLHSFYSSSLPLKADKYLLTHLYGAWAREAQVDHTLLTHGSKSIESTREVRTTHTENPAFLLTLNSDSFSETCGEVIAGALAWSGNFRLNFEVDEFDVLTVLAGANPNASEYRLRPGETFTTPEMIYTHSFCGAGGASRNLHDWARNYGVYHGHEAVPTLLNSWEGAYFKFDAKVLKQMIDDAASMGLEMFVLDDGWFGNKYPRNNSNAGLGDWQVNAAKLPEGIDHIASYAHSKGLKFGIWIEPEMTNTRSELYEKHPDWVIQQPYRENRKGRGGTQQVLDLSNPAVQEFVFGVVDRLMTAHPDIAYIKWDDNMTLYNYGSTFLPADRQSHLYIEYHRGMDKVLRRIREKYPRLVMQSCASGGGRVNYGVLPYYDEFWTSDNTDALQRIYMQWGVSNFYPAVAMASHVSASPNHQTGRNVPLKLRFDVAMSGRLGLELQPSKMTGKEKEFARRAIADYKEIRPIVQQGDLYRLISPYDKTGYASLMYVAPEKDRAVWFVYKLEHFLNMPSPAFRMAGLDPGKRYRITELNVDGKPVPQDGKTFSGAFLMENGLEFTVGKEYASRVLELKAVE